MSFERRQQEVSLSENEQQTQEMLEKKSRWSEALARIERVKDRLGKGIDENAKETVVAFLVNEFPTQQSCEGHLEERFGKMERIDPYITIGSRTCRNDMSEKLK